MDISPTPKQPASYATPTELRERAKAHMDKWRELLQTSPRAARDELNIAINLTELADEAEESASKHNRAFTNSELARMGE